MANVGNVGASPEDKQPPKVPPSQQPQAPGATGGISFPKGGAGPDSKIKFSVLLYEMFAAIAGLYTFLTQHTLKGLNAALRHYSDKENGIAARLAAAENLKCPSKHQAMITDLKNQQQQVQTEITTIQGTQTAVSSGVATLASQMNGINTSVLQAMSGIVQNM